MIDFIATWYVKIGLAGLLGIGAIFVLHVAFSLLKDAYNLAKWALGKVKK